ncbi:hypothetical protein ACTHRT_11155, partial [Neisseria sp. P0004.S008]|uniref:hypothetical protein n=1 Tax=Neisseria sp. P0004.S008 TaxID=3436672 RepID=UPI003F7EE9E5
SNASCKTTVNKPKQRGRLKKQTAVQTAYFIKQQLGKACRNAYNQPFLSGGELGFDGVCKADAGIPGSQNNR